MTTDLSLQYLSMWWYKRSPV